MTTSLKITDANTSLEVGQISDNKKIMIASTNIHDVLATKQITELSICEAIMMIDFLRSKVEKIKQMK